jgi:protein-S-isoprenylcysteine O-methyltransferase Ste14
MAKLIALLNVVAWSGFWAFGYLALSADAADAAHMTTALILAAVGAALGIWAWFWLVRHSEATGYAKPANRVIQTEDT